MVYVRSKVVDDGMYYLLLDEIQMYMREISIWDCLSICSMVAFLWSFCVMGQMIKLRHYRTCSVKTIFKDRREFTGSLMQQMNEVYDFIDFRNQTRATIEKLYRIDVRDYPEIAVREALLNLLVHRDYSFSASALISIYADRIEFVSIGGLMPGIDLEDIMVGISVCRNQDLANVFYRLHLIEAYGTGMGKIMRAYEGTEERPMIETTKNAFKLILPNINAKYETGRAFVPKTESVKSAVAGTEKKLGNEEKVLEYARSHGSITRNDVIELLEVSTSTASRVLRKMVKSNLLKQNGKARNTNYTVIK